VINVNFKISQGILSAAATPLNFTQAAGGAAPAAQAIAVTGSPASLNFTVATSTADGNNWLTATPSGATPANVLVQVNAGALPVGNYTGTVTISSPGAAGSPIAVPISLAVVQPLTLSTSPTSFSFAFTSGQAIPASQTLAVTASAAGTPVNAQAQYSGTTSGWLSVSPASAASPASFTLSVSPTGLPGGTYNATIALSAQNVSSPTSIPVVLTVTTIAQPVINAIANAANYSTAGISPGENVVIFGTGIGPATLAVGSVSNGALATTAGNTRVLFDGVPAPIIYASASQTAVMVPYGLNGRGATNIVVEYLNIQSSPNTYFVTAAAPGIYTLNQQGTGQGAILNQDGITVNGPDTPEKRGNVIAVYMTGEGQTDPQGSDGAIIPSVVSALKKPVLPVTATIGGFVATVAYAGSAPGLVSGIMQVNLVIPDGAPSGPRVQLVITVGTSSTQVGSGAVTLAIQ
jgi:uncharacterized protein (TIGR03437 family)